MRSLARELLDGRESSPVRLVYGTATDINTVQVDGETTAVVMPAISTVVAGDRAAVLKAGGDRVIVGPVGSAPVPFTPSLTSTGATPTLGTGSSATGSYCGDTGNVVEGHGELVFGTSGVSGGSGAYAVSLPESADTSIHTASSTPGAGAAIGSVVLLDSNTGAYATGVLQLFSGFRGQILLSDTLSTRVAVTVPWTWAASDAIRYSFRYFAAP